MTDDYKNKFDKYLMLMQKHYDKVKDNPRIDLMNDTQNAMSLDEALDILEKF